MLGCLGPRPVHQLPPRGFNGGSLRSESNPIRQPQEAEVGGEEGEGMEYASLKASQGTQPPLPPVGFFANTKSLSSFSHTSETSSGLVLGDPWS